MREIKFRAMTKPPKDFAHYHFGSGMVYGTGLFFDGLNHWLYRHDINVIANDFENHIIKPETIGEYTGLKDKSGKEVYEGDILSWGCGYTITMKWQKTDKSETYGHGSYGKGILCGFYYDGYYGSMDNCEIIGNIHESPELLNG